jgi:hypothetical protein
MPIDPGADRVWYQHTLEGRRSLHLSLPVESLGVTRGRRRENNAILWAIVESDLVSCLFLLIA